MVLSLLLQGESGSSASSDWELALKPGSLRLWRQDSLCHPHPRGSLPQTERNHSSSLAWVGVGWGESLFSSPQLILEQEKWWCPLPTARPELAGGNHNCVTCAAALADVSTAKHGKVSFPESRKNTYPKHPLQLYQWWRGAWPTGRIGHSYGQTSFSFECNHCEKYHAARSPSRDWLYSQGSLGPLGLLDVWTWPTEQSHMKETIIREREPMVLTLKATLQGTSIHPKCFLQGKAG